ncbi:hypothetical protein LUZ60_009563 [Juncus effusus]|nr:hypothetical protein LUZ60_009563 [Juncus effusus]
MIGRNGRKPASSSWSRTIAVRYSVPFFLTSLLLSPIHHSLLPLPSPSPPLFPLLSPLPPLLHLQTLPAMADRIYPSAKPNPQPPSGGGGPIGPPPIKSQTYQRPIYRPPAPTKSRRRSGRSCCRCFFCWVVVVILLLVFLAAIAGGAFYLLYRPHRPTFTVSSVRLSTLNLTSSNSLTSNVDLTVVAHNPNKKIVFLYDDISVSISTNGVDIGDGSVPGFRHDAKNSTTITTKAGVSKQSVDPSSTSDLKKSKLPLTVDLETKAGVQVGKLTTKKAGIKVHCEGFQAAAPVKGKPGVVDTANVACQVKLRVKIWKWTF